MLRTALALLSTLQIGARIKESVERSLRQAAIVTVAAVFLLAASIFGLEVAVYLRGDSPGGTASTTVDVRFDEPILLRPGPLDLGI